MTPPTNIKTIITAAAKELSQADIESPQLDAKLLLCHLLNWSQEDLLRHSNETLSPKKTADYQALIKRRKKREPVAHIMGYKDFWKYRFEVTADTLVPRPDSETLIEAVLSHYNDTTQQLQILDLGTGSGCLLLSLLGEYPNAAGVGVDQSDAALEVAARNAKQLGFNKRITFCQSNWFSRVDGIFDLIVANPPYIDPTAEANLQNEVRDYEPKTALYADNQGLADYKAICQTAPAYMQKNTALVFEIGCGQASDVIHIGREAGFNCITKHKDLAGITRVLVFTYGI